MPSHSFTCSFLGTHLPVEHPDIHHSCFNQGFFFFASHLSEKSPCISVEQVNILDVAAVNRHNSWLWYFHLIIFLPIILPRLWFQQFTNKHRNASDVAVIFKYNSRNIHRMNVCGMFLWKTMWLPFWHVAHLEIFSLKLCSIVQYQYNELPV